jgi:2,4-dienoyl-CoA reductase-like NADH-dependent reductase (Old Yellow Enzyme family)
MFHASTRRFWEPEFVGSGLGFAGWVKRLAGVPVIVVGSVGLDVDVMASLAGQDASSSNLAWLGELRARFDAGEFDLVAVGRAVLADAEWVSKIRTGKFDTLKPFTKEALAFLS